MAAYKLDCNRFLIIHPACFSSYLFWKLIDNSLFMRYWANSFIFMFPAPRVSIINQLLIMKHLFFFLCSSLFLYSCSKVSSREFIENPPDNKVSAFTPVPTKSEVRQIVYDAIIAQGITASQITDASHLENDLMLDLSQFIGYLTGRINFSIPLNGLPLTTVKNTIDYISDVLLKEQTKSFSVSRTINLSSLNAGHPALPATLNMGYLCKVKYIDLDAAVTITAIEEVKCYLDPFFKSNEITTNNIEVAKSNVAGSNDVIYDYVISYAPYGLGKVTNTSVFWNGILSIKVFAAHKCEGFNNVHKIHDVSVSLERESDFEYFTTTTFEFSVIMRDLNWTPINNESWTLPTPPCATPGGGNPGTPKPTITAALLQSKLFNVINEEMTDLGRPISNLSMSTRLIEDLEFTKISMETVNDFDLDFIEFMLAIENEFGAPVDFPDNVVETFTTVGSIYNYMTTLFTVI